MKHKGDEAYLPVEPFREWCVRVKAAKTNEEFALLIGWSPKRVGELLDEESTIEVVTFSDVDRALIREGGSNFLDVYGEIEFECLRLVERRQKRRPTCRECGLEMLTKAELCGFCVRELVAA